MHITTAMTKAIIFATTGTFFFTFPQGTYATICGITCPIYPLYLAFSGHFYQLYADPFTVIKKAEG